VPLVPDSLFCDDPLNCEIKNKVGIAERMASCNDCNPHACNDSN
jgi:hypothetical protein